MKHTSEYWQHSNGFKYLIVCDPDGWNRSNFEYSWFRELITKEEFQKRLSKSTVLRQSNNPDANTITEIKKGQFKPT